MRKGFALLVGVLGIAGSAIAGGVDKAKVREFLHLPNGSANFAICFDSSGGFFLPSEIDEIPGEIAALKQILVADAKNAEKWARLSEICWRVGQPELAEEAQQKAVALFRERVATTPEDGFAQARLADALPATAHEEAEKLVRRSLELAPRDWRCWLFCGRYLRSRGVYALLGTKAETQSLGLSRVISLIKETRPNPEQVDTAQKLFDEERVCYDRAIALAPNEPRVYIERAGSAFSQGSLHYAFFLARGQPANFNDLATPEMVADIQKAAGLGSGDYRALGAGVLYELTSDAGRNPSSFTKKEQKTIDLLPEDARERTKAALERLEGFAASKDPVEAAGALEILGSLKYVLENDSKEAARYLGRAVTFRPCRGQTWTLLISMLSDLGNEKETLAACKAWVEHKDCLQSRMMLARGYEQMNDVVKAEEQIRLALHHKPRDFVATVALVTLLLKYGTDDTALREADELLYKIGRALGDSPSGDWKTNYIVLRGAYLALTDHVQEACGLLKDYLPFCPQNSEPAQLLKLLQEE